VGLDRLRPPAGASSFDVDHKLEMQLGGDDTTPKGNLWLLESSTNREAGRTIADAIEANLQAVLDQVEPELKAVPSYREVRKDYEVSVEVANLEAAKDSKDVADQFWTLDDLKSDSLTKPLKRVGPGDIARLKGKPSELSIYSTKSGGSLRPVVPGDQSAWQKTGISKAARSR
jgi:hypothetical protein